MSQNFWVSWQQHTEDYRPKRYPPNKKILGWWNSGQGYDYWTLCAMVRADTKEEAEQAIYKDWPEAKDQEEWRFFEEDVTLEMSDRWPKSDWMEERFNAVGMDS